MIDLTAHMDALPLKVVSLPKSTSSQYFIPDSHFPPIFLDAVVATHQAAKTPTQRIKHKSKIFKSPYITEFGSGSKDNQDKTTEM